ncbi:uncharacterized protein LOC128883272 [Hylaeus volcanicus]|uniref:uncharacterized protein LOC128883272 n=1 Tax=Hylaeus volcanicus TaxID=313075 RepID=UPI0023B8836C|nr:uncharacterized protein LOC128883272 [Hylaeus volcanicus]
MFCDSSNFPISPKIQSLCIDQTDKKNILNALCLFDDVLPCSEQNDHLDYSTCFPPDVDDLLKEETSVGYKEQGTLVKKVKDRVSRSHDNIKGPPIKRIKHGGTFTDHERSIILRRVADIISFAQQKCHLHIHSFLSAVENKKTKWKNVSSPAKKCNLYSDEALQVLNAKHSNKSYGGLTIKELTLIVSVYALCGRCCTLEERNIMQSIMEKGDVSLALANIEAFIKILSPRVICSNEKISSDIVRLVASLLEFNCSIQQKAISIGSTCCYNCQQPLAGVETQNHVCEMCGAVELFDTYQITNDFQFDDLFAPGRSFFNNTTIFSRFSRSSQGQQRVKNRIYEAVRSVCQKVNILSEQQITSVVQNVVRYAQSGRTATIKKIIAACIFLYIRNEQEIVSLPQIAVPLDLHLSTLTSTVQRVVRVLGLQNIASISYQNLISHSIQCLLKKDEEPSSEATTDEIRLVEQQAVCETTQGLSFNTTNFVDTLALFETSSSSTTVPCTMRQMSEDPVLSNNDIAIIFDKLINDENLIAAPNAVDKNVLCIDKLLNEGNREKEYVTQNKHAIQVSQKIKRNRRKNKESLLFNIEGTQKKLWIRTTEILYQCFCSWRELLQKNMFNQNDEFFQTKSAAGQLYFVASAMYYSSVYLKLNVLTKTVATSLGINTGTFHRVRKLFINDLENILRYYGLISDMTELSSYSKNMCIIQTTLSNNYILNFESDK